MKIFNTKNLADALELTKQHLQYKTKKAKNKNQSHITIKSQTFYFRNKLEGKGYEFCEVPFSELSVSSPADNLLKDTCIFETQKEREFREIMVSNEVELLNLTPFQQEQIDMKELIVLEANKTRMNILEFAEYFTKLHAQKLETLKITINKSGLRRWKKAYKESGKYGLMKKSGHTTGKRWKLSDSLIQEIEDIFFVERGNITAPNIYKAMNAKALNDGEITYEEYVGTRKGLGGVVSLGTVKNKIVELKKTAKYKYLINPDKYKNSFLPAFGDMRAKAEYANHYWEIDSTQLDAFGKDGSGETTWQLISISDIKTGMKVLTVAKTSNSKAIAELLYKAFSKLGIPEHIVTDNGKDYLSNHILGLFKSFGINHVRTEPFAGEQKPFVERHFGTLQNSFTELLNGFKGHDVAGFKAIQSQVAKGTRLMGKAPDRGVEFIHEIATKLDEWIDNVYAHEFNRSLESSPYEVFQKDSEMIYRTDVANLAYIFGKSVEVNIGKKGIRLNKKVYNNKHGLLGEIVGTKALLILDFLDVNIGYLFDLEGKFIALVTDEKISINGAVQARKAYKNQIKAFEKENKLLKEQHKGVNHIEAILEASKKANANLKPIESIGGDAITQNSKLIDGLAVTGQSLTHQIEAIQIVNEKPNLELHEKALKISEDKEVEKAKGKPVISYSNLLKMEA